MRDILLIRKEVNHGWPTFTLSTSILLCASAPSAGAPLPISAPQTVPLSELAFTSSDITRLIIAIGSILIVQTLIPAVRHYYERRSERKTFRIYLYAHAKNTKASYGVECSVVMARQILGVGDSEVPPWLAVLDHAGLGAPRELISMHEALNKAEQCAANNEDSDNRYFPYLSYFGVSGSPLELKSPLWKSSDTISRRASSYFITEVQIATSIKAQYESDFLDLMRKGGESQRRRWCEAGKNVLLDMAEHYVATIRLLDELKNTIRR